MKTLVNSSKNTFLLGLIAFSFIMSSCEEDEQPDVLISEEVKEILWKYGINGDMAQKYTYELRGTTRKGYLIDDIFIHEDNFEDFKETILKLEQARDGSSKGGRTEAFRSKTFVSSPDTATRNIKIEVWTDEITPVEVKGISDAIEEYNALDLRLQFTLVENPNPTFPFFVDGGTIVFRSTRAGVGGTAGFPFEGDPGDVISLNSDVPTASAADIKHLFLHELGHTLGMRHSDYQTRRSCVEAGVETMQSNEGEGNLGAICIDGTNCNGNETNSVWKACFTLGSVPGTFLGEDETALKSLY